VGSSNINRTLLGDTYNCCNVSLHIYFLSVVITMREQVVPSAVAQCIIVKFLTNENMKRAQILKRLRAQFGDETPPGTQVYD